MEEAIEETQRRREIQLEYNEEHGYEAATIDPPFIVADDSKFSIRPENEAVCDETTLETTYVDDYDEVGIHKSVKLHDAVQRVDTPYLTLCADDDFVLQSGIERTVSFLRDNDDYVCAHGRHCGFKPLPGLTQPWFYWKPGRLKGSLSEDDPKRRLQQHLSEYGAPTYYAVVRTLVAEFIYGKAGEHTDDLRFGEILPTMLTSLQGKMKQFDMCYSFRSLNPGVSHEVVSYADYAVEGSFTEKYERFRSCLTEELVAKSDVDESTAAIHIDDWMINFLTNSSRLSRAKAQAAVEGDLEAVTEADLRNPASIAYRVRERLSRKGVPQPVLRGAEWCYRGSVDRLQRFPTKVRERALGPLGVNEGRSRAAFSFYRNHWDEFQRVRDVVRRHPVELTDRNFAFCAIGWF